MTYWKNKQGDHFYIVYPDRTYVGIHWQDARPLKIPEGHWFTDKDDDVIKMTKLECRLRGLL